jgi:uncharacterized YigZ family protein
MIDHYKTITAPSTGEFKDRGSKFFAYAFPIFTEEEWQEELEAVKKEHFKARHHCYAYRLGVDQNNFRANDDGEPSGTAGRPILGQIDSFELTNVIVIVVRYFGGTKLGTSGLINAYKLSAAAALENATIEERLIEDVYTLDFEYHLMPDVMNALKKLALNVIKQDFGHKGHIQIAIRQSEIEATLAQLKALIANVHLEEVEEMDKIEGLELELAYTR